MFLKMKKAIKEPKKILPYLFSLPKKLLLKQRQRRIKKIIVKGENFYEYKGDLYPEYLNRGNAVSFIEDKSKLYCQGTGLDIGASIWPLAGAIPIQNEKHQNAYKLDSFSNDSLDYIFSSHCLEHLERWQTALKLWIKKLKVNGVLFLYLPHKSMKLWLVGEPWAGYEHKWIPTYKTIIEFLKKNGMDIVEYNPGKDKYWSFHIVAKKVK